jgi:hypothetical protein
MSKFEKYMQDPETVGGKFDAYMRNLVKEKNRSIEEGNERLKNERRQKQYEYQDKQEGRAMKSGGKVSSASKRADGCAIKGKTKGRMV